MVRCPATWVEGSRLPAIACRLAPDQGLPCCLAYFRIVVATGPHRVFSLAGMSRATGAGRPQLGAVAGVVLAAPDLRSRALALIPTALLRAPRQRQRDSGQRQRGTRIRRPLRRHPAMSSTFSTPTMPEQEQAKCTRASGNVSVFVCNWSGCLGGGQIIL